MIPYVIVVVTSLLVGLAVALVYGRKLDARAFLAGALVNAAALGSVLLAQKRRQR